LRLVVICATAAKASCKALGNVLPRFSARLRIPAQAVGLKKYFGGTSVSKTRDNEHAAPSLGDSEVLSVQHSPGRQIPELRQPLKYDGKVPAAGRRQ
jgi:hypothetical protein